eukprot:TRINITY_DN4779_c0_g1_i1.p1 TRINITY_DN4779_c0_g1~~TRINITY_DN4779_c0_g1_i1.p1  ORF type:complete len:170 (+),score=7.43 TRINITY_DN4779_c0_g1_i1:136-645(+)
MASATSSDSKPKAPSMAIKFLLDGDAGVGKSSISLRYCENLFTESWITTIGIDFKMKKLIQNDMEIKIQVWEHGGRERFRTLTRNYYVQAQFLLLIFSVTDLRSFEFLNHHLTSTEPYRPASCKVVVIANKIDLPESQRVVTPDMGLFKHVYIPIKSTSNPLQIHFKSM